MTWTEEPYVCVSPITRCPWSYLAGVPCDGHDGYAVAKWAVWTSADTGDGFRVACDDCVGGWVISVSSRL
jgi:hypothetical protein